MVSHAIVHNYELSIPILMMIYPSEFSVPHKVTLG